MKVRTLLLMCLSFAAAADVERPSLIPETRVQPNYTEEARKAKISGVVMLEINIDAEGVPSVSRVLTPLGYGLDEKAMEALRQWRFRPAKEDGKPVPCVANVEFNFRLTDSPPPSKNQ